MPPAIITILIRCAEHHPQRGQRERYFFFTKEATSRTAQVGLNELARAYPENVTLEGVLRLEPAE